MSKMRVALKTAAVVISGCVLLGSIAPAQAGRSTGTWKYYQPGYPVVPGYPPAPAYQPVPGYYGGYDGYRQGYRDGYRQARPDYDNGYDYRYYGRPRPYYQAPRYDED